MSVRVREGIEVVPTFAGCSGFDSFLSRIAATGKNEFHSSKLLAIAGRSAEFCLAHLRAKHFGHICSQQNRNSGQRAASGCSTRNNRGASWMDTYASCRAVENPKGKGYCNPPSRDASSRYRVLPPRIPFKPIRPGPYAEPSGYVLRFCVAGIRRYATAKGIGVRE